MGKTYKSFTYSYLRVPRGRKAALIQGVRKKAVPPDPWEDICHDMHCYLPMRAAENMRKQGVDDETIIKKIRRKFKLSQNEAERVVSWLR